MPERETYVPRPIDTKGVSLPHPLERLVEVLAESNHDNWSAQRMRDGWTWGEKRNDDVKQHPGLVAYHQLTETEKEYDRITVRETLKGILASGYEIVPPSS